MSCIPEVGTVCGIPLVGTETGPATVRSGSVVAKVVAAVDVRSWSSQASHRLKILATDLTLGL